MNQSSSIDEPALTEQQWSTLQAIADLIVPPSDQYQVPGAGDPAICENIVKDASSRLDRLLSALATLDEMAAQTHDRPYAELEKPQRGSVGAAFQATHPRAAAMLQTLVSQCYYRDDRVLASLGMDVRPPFPEGYEVDAGDWSVLDTVRQRAPFHRSVS